MINERMVRTFPAIDECGERLLLHVYVQSDPEAISQDATIIRTPKGENVYRMEKGKYQIITTSVFLRSDDPDAL